MKRLLLFTILCIFALSAVAFAGRAVIGSGQIIECSCTPKDGSYICFDETTDLPLPPCP